MFYLREFFIFFKLHTHIIIYGYIASIQIMNDEINCNN